MGGIDSVIDIDDDEDGNEEGGEAEEDQTGEGKETHEEHNADGSEDGGLAIDELDKANFSSKHGTASKQVAKNLVFSPIEPYLDSDQESFVLACALAKNDKTSTSSATAGELCDQSKQLMVGQDSVDMHGDEDDSIVGETVFQKTPATIWKKKIATLDGEKSNSMDYCEDLLKSVDLSESENEELIEEDLRVLPPKAIHIP